MLFDGRHINAYSIRRDGGPRPFDPNKIKGTIKFENGDFVIKIEDDANPEFWMQIVVSQSELDKAKEQ